MEVTLHSEAALQGLGLDSEQGFYASQWHPGLLAHLCQSLHHGHSAGESTEITCYPLQTQLHPVA